MQAVDESKTPLEKFGEARHALAEFNTLFENLAIEKRNAMQMAKKQHTDKIAGHLQKAQDYREQILQEHETQLVNAGKINAQYMKCRAMEAEVLGLAKKLAEIQQTQMTLKRENEAKQKRMASIEEALEFTKRNLDVQTQKDIDESTKFEMYAGLKVEALEEDLLRFRFVNVDSNDIDREVSCELYVGAEFYRVGATHPPLSATTISGMEAGLNGQGTFVQFLWQIRKALRDAI